jgi:O-acetyl-ADP-ribose deacetylase (regulator of RNase III)
MKKIKYVMGDATQPISSAPLQLLVHCCNDQGFWGRGFVLALSDRWSRPEHYYRLWSKGINETPPSIHPYIRSELAKVYQPPECKPFALGRCQFVPVEYNLMVVNMVGQHDVRWKDGKPPVRYDAIRSCLQEVAQYALLHGADVHGPCFGAGLAGGTWATIDGIIQEELCAKDIDVTIYSQSQIISV